MALKRTVEPTELPVLLQEVKAHLRVTSATEDADILSYMHTAVSTLDGPEGLLNRALITQTLEMTMDCFPWSDAFDLPLPPMQSVSSIQYIDTNGDTQALATSNYRVLNANTPMAKGRIELAYGKTWPTVRDVEQAVTVTYIAGYGARNDVPHHTRHLILTIVKELYDGRDPFLPENMARSPSYVGLFTQAGYPVVA